MKSLLLLCTCRPKGLRISQSKASSCAIRSHESRAGWIRMGPSPSVPPKESSTQAQVGSETGDQLWMRVVLPRTTKKRGGWLLSHIPSTSGSTVETFCCLGPHRLIQQSRQGVRQPHGTLLGRAQPWRQFLPTLQGGPCSWASYRLYLGRSQLQREQQPHPCQGWGSRQGW